jgi:hypothetical protein
MRCRWSVARSEWDLLMVTQAVVQQ